MRSSSLNWSSKRNGSAQSKGAFLAMVRFLVGYGKAPVSGQSIGITPDSFDAFQWFNIHF